MSWSKGAYIFIFSVLKNEFKSMKYNGYKKSEDKKQQKISIRSFIGSLKSISENL